MHPYFAAAIGALMATTVRLFFLWVVVSAYDGAMVSEVGRRALAYTVLDGLGMLTFGLTYVFLVRLNWPLPAGRKVSDKLGNRRTDQ